MDKNTDEFELMIAAFNENFFFKEFTYSTNKFFHKKQPLQAGDCIVYLDEILLIFEIKNRNLSAVRSSEENGWFSIKWSFLNEPWVEDLETTNFLKSNPLDKVELKVLPRYEFLNN